MKKLGHALLRTTLSILRWLVRMLKEASNTYGEMEIN